MRSRLAAGLLTIAALAAAGVGISGAAFTAGSANPGNDFGTAATFPAVSMDDPGTPLRGTVALTATTGGAIVSVTIQRSPAGAGTWTDVCTDSSSPYSCSFDTTGVGDGLYDLRATADTGSGTITSTAVANRRVDNTNPAVTMTDPGTPLSGTVSLGATATDTGGSGVASVTIQRSPAGAGTWTDVCTDTTSPYSCSFDTTSVGDGLYDFRAVGTDNAGNTANSTVANRRVDNVAPTSSLTDPGSPLSATVTLNATASDGGGIANVKIQRSPAGAGTWTDICTDTTSPYSCSFDTTGVGDGLYDLRAVATDNGGRSTNSTVVANRRVDNTAPAVTMTDPGANLRGTISLGATATDTGGSGVASVTIQRSPAGAGTWTDICTDTTSPYSCSFDTTAVGDGLYDFRAVGTDNAGNSANSTVANRRVDNTAPTAGLTDPGTPLRGTVTLNATGTDTGGSGVANVKIQRSPAGAGTWTDICTDTTSPYSCSFDTTGVGDGLYDVRAVSTDNAGNTANSTVVTNRRVDNTNPAVTMTDPGTPLAGTVSLGATATDTGGSGVASVTIQRSPAGAGTWTDVCTDTTSPYSCSFDTTSVGDALYDFRAVGTDNAGNTANSTVANRRVDNVAPSVSITDPGANLRGTIAVDATASDGGGILNVKIQRSPAGAGTWTDICTDTTSPYSCNFDTTGVADGLYDLRALATDNASRTATSTVTNRRVDNTLPTATMTDPGSPLRLTVTLNATSTDTGGSGVSSVTIQRSPAGAGTWTDVCTDTTSPYSCSFDTTAVGDGLYDLRAVSIDVAGNPNTSATVANRRVDNTAPTAGLTDPGSPLRLTVTLNATGTDTGGSGVANVKIQRSPAGAGTWTDICTDTTSPYSCSWNTTGVADGSYDLRAVSADNAGNTTNSTTVASRIVDNTAPTAGLTDPGSPLRLTVTLNATGTDTGGSGVANVKIQRSPAGAGSWTDICTATGPYSCSWNTTGVADGSYDLRSVTTDNAGNQTNSATVASRVVDNTAPTATDIQTTNASGGTAGKPEAGDTIVFSFSEQIAPGTIVAGWNGTGTQTVTVTMHGGNLLSVTGATIVNGDLTLGGAGYVNNGKTVVFSNSTIAQSGATVTITLGTPDKPQFLNTGSAGQSSWPVPAALTDVAGNAITTVTRLEIVPPNDAEF